MKTIELKTDSKVFQLSKDGLKPYEIRYIDRDYQVDDEVILKETKYTGAQMRGNPKKYPLVFTGRVQGSIQEESVQHYPGMGSIEAGGWNL